ncbi:aldehyde dehydrogenase family protein [Nocardia arthritidis]|uniref:aldehyde dehydrogenase family protein n=1 Tax=Nocardia arthritidis TaxID=228602 RepID=UPI00142DC42B|nr:aldehyde dehydrogenase family protein [Nocardia arthritidis]
MITTIDPATGKPLDTYPFTTDAELAAALELAVRRELSVDERANGLRRLAVRLRDESVSLAALITAEMGKSITQAAAELEKCAVTCEYYADHLAELLAPQSVDVLPDTGRIRMRPLGVVLAIMPWNYPFWQVFRSMAPAIAIGNRVLLKHADNVSGCAVAVQRLFDEAFGPGVLTGVRLEPERIGRLIDDPAVAAVAFTGSNRVGAVVGARAGRAVKKSVLELGGSDPFIVLADADVPLAAAAAARSRYLNNGQSCLAAKRIIVERSVFSEFVAELTGALGTLAYGDPALPETFIGPMARIDLRDELRRQLDASVAAGAKVLSGGEFDDRPGAWFTPTLIEVPGPDCPAFREETFGPLGAVFPVGSAEHALAVANSSVYGLSCAIWGTDRSRIDRLADRVTAGSVFINRISESDPRLPVGGVAASGYGRELSAYGALEFANIQAVRTAQVPRSRA